MDVSLVIPGRNVAGTIRRCLDAVTPLLGRGELREIIFVDDGSTDESGGIVAEYPVTQLRVDGLGPGGARNVGWRAASGEAVWFIDADCVAGERSLAALVRLFDGPEIAGVGGSYSNAQEDSLLACLIHEEIVERHASMSGRVDFLGSFNVLYRRRVLEQAGGFDERHFNAASAPGAEDADLSYRICDLGYTLRFARDSRVGHFHSTRLRSYFRSQRLHGIWGVRLYYRHPGRAGRNSYSSWIDHLQPPLATATVLALPTLLIPETRWIAPVMILCLAALQVPMALRLVARTRQWRYAMFIPMGMARAAARGLGMISGFVSLLGSRPKPAKDSLE